MTSPTGFARDKAHFLTLCNEVITRLAGHTDLRTFAPVGPLLLEMKHLAFATRLGFPVGTPIPSQRKNPEGETECFIIWNDPTGAGGGELHYDAFGPNSPGLGEGYRVEARAGLHRVMTMWRRAVIAKVEFAPYPAMPSVRLDEANPNLARDPMWNALHWVSGYHLGKHFDDDRGFAIEQWPEWVVELNTLAQYEGESELGIFRIKTKKGGVQHALVVAMPDAGGPVELPFIEGGKLGPKSQRQLRETIVRWAEARARRIATVSIHHSQVGAAEHRAHDAAIVDSGVALVPHGIGRNLDGFAAPTELAQHLGINKERLRKILSRARKRGDIPDTAWMQQTERKPREAAFLYRKSEVERLVQRVGLSSELSGECPANENPST